MHISIIISYYKNLENLKLILRALENQSSRDFELIVSEDDHNLETQNFITKNRSSLSYPIQHLWQEEDRGFRKTQMLNRSIQIAKHDFIVFIDGDCIPHPRFVESYTHATQSGYIYWGRRVMLDQDTSQKILDSGDFKYLKTSYLLQSGSTHIREGVYLHGISLGLKQRGIWGCNWGIHKKDLYTVNGYDEDYNKAGIGEDTDIEWRLLAAGIAKKSMKNKAIVYHLFHESNYSQEDVQYNQKLLDIKVSEGKYFCSNGIIKSEKEST